MLFDPEPKKKEDFYDREVELREALRAFERDSW